MSVFSKSKPAQAAQSEPPSANAEPAAPSQEQLRRSGRASLIATSPQGILGSPTTGRKQLLSSVGSS